MGLFRRELTSEKIADLVELTKGHGDEDRCEEAWEAAKPLRKAYQGQQKAADALAHLLKRGSFGPERGLVLATMLFESYGDQPWALAAIGNAAETIHDMRYLNAAPLSEEVFIAVANRLKDMLPSVKDGEDEAEVLDGLSVLARILGRSWDDVAEAAYLRIVEMKPDSWQEQYNLGLFYKTRGRFADGQAANQRAAELGGEDNGGVIWNLGICATGAGDADTALATWKKMGQKIEMGRFGLPEGGYPSSKVRLAEFPLAERKPGEEPDGPGQEETIWIERLSPSHGIIRSALFHDIGVDFGDVILIDGAPITHHKYGDDDIPVFPHLATLSKENYRIYEFAGTQAEEGQVAALSGSLSEDAVVYVHTEQFENLCKCCWENPDLEHQHDEGETHNVVTGKLCAPATMSVQQLRDELDKALADAPDVRLFVPDLAREAGDAARADVEARRMAMIQDSSN